jgi:hypothetical protein
MGKTRFITVPAAAAQALVALLLLHLATVQAVTVPRLLSMEPRHFTQVEEVVVVWETQTVVVLSVPLPVGVLAAAVPVASSTPIQTTTTALRILAAVVVGIQGAMQAPAAPAS